jgi:hypothetical protein
MQNENTQNDPATASRKARTAKDKPNDLLDLLRNPTLGAISLTDAARIVGVAPSTAHAHFMATGEFLGIRVGAIGSRRVVSTRALRAFLGLDDPQI